jgi:3-methylfumaryl-CoA hydratase
MRIRMSLDVAHLQFCIGRSETLHDVVTTAPLRALAGTLDRDDVPDQLPPCWHWLPVHRQSDIGPDGHALREGILPPVPLSRRRWAGSRLRFVALLRIGQSITRTSRIDDVRLNERRSGPLVFVNLRHGVRGDGELAIDEQHDSVYRDHPHSGEASTAGVPAPDDAAWTWRIVPDHVLLFRYSALTFNGRRIHFGRRSVTTVEGFPGLAVHGPLVATLLLDLMRRELPAARAAGFSFKAVKQLFDVPPFHMCGRRVYNETVKLWTRTPEGHVAMDAGLTLA